MAKERKYANRNVLEKLVEIGEGAIEKYQSRIDVGDIDTHRKIYNALTRKLAPTLPEYNTNTLRQLVFIRAKRNEDAEDKEAIVRGLYTGVLASELTKRNASKGERTKISLNGGGNDFPYLLYFAHTLDEVMVEGFNGDCILSYAASYGGNVKNAVLKDITGYSAGASIASNHGRAGTVTLAGIMGGWAGAEIACYGGRAGTVTLAGITGNSAGEGIARVGGRADIVTLAGITGKDAGWRIAENGRADIVTLAGITGDLAGASVANIDGSVKRLFAGDNKGKNHFLGYDGKIIPLQKHKNATQIEELLRQLHKERNPKKLTVISRQLAKSLKNYRRR